MRVADPVVSSSIRCASTFERHRSGNLHRLYCGPFGFAQHHNQLAKGDVRSDIYLSA
jgi:hypothetical protein